MIYCNFWGDFSTSQAVSDVWSKSAPGYNWGVCCLLNGQNSQSHEQKTNLLKNKFKVNLLGILPPPSPHLNVEFALFYIESRGKRGY